MIRVEDLQTIEYGKAWRYQQELFDNNIQLKSEGDATINHLLLCEHPHTITLGKNANYNNLLFNESYLSEQGISLFKIDRGGDITYHGIGQLVVYPIFDLHNFGIGLRKYIHLIEQAIINTLAEYGIKGTRMEGAAGIWLDDKENTARKIAAIGVRSSRYITMHGLALNVNTDLHYFSYINPCGFVDKGVSSMEKELGKKIDMNEVKEIITDKIIRLFVLSDKAVL